MLETLETGFVAMRPIYAQNPSLNAHVDISRGARNLIFWSEPSSTPILWVCEK